MMNNLQNPWESPWIAKLKQHTEKAPAYALKGTVLLLIDHEQIRRHNLVALTQEDDLSVDPTYNPNEWSIDEAIVVGVNIYNQFLKAGDRVLIDFGIFTSGMQEDIQMTDATRIAGRDEKGVYYYANDATNPDTTEIFGKVVPVGTDNFTIVPYPGIVFVEMPKSYSQLQQEKGIAFWKQEEDRETNPFEANVTFSNVPGVPVGTRILIEPCMSIEIRTSLGKFEYVNAEYILGIIDENDPVGIRLF